MWMALCLPVSDTHAADRVDPNAAIPKATDANKPATMPAEVIYNRVKRSPAWVDATYKRLGKYVLITPDGLVINSGRIVAMQVAKLMSGVSWVNTIVSDPPLKGSVVQACCTVLQVISKTEVIATLREAITSEIMTIHITGDFGQDLTDGATVPQTLMQYLGPYSYVNVAGAKATIQSYGLCRQVTKTEFILALTKGFVLKEYKRVPVKPNYKLKHWDKDLIGANDTWFRIVETKVP
jgi:hypothetical protein